MAVRSTALRRLTPSAASREEEVAADDLVAAVAAHPLERLVGVDDRAVGLGGVGEDDSVAGRVDRQIAQPEAGQHVSSLVAEESGQPDHENCERAVGETLPELALFGREAEGRMARTLARVAT